MNQLRLCVVVMVMGLAAISEAQVKPAPDPESIAGLMALADFKGTIDFCGEPAPLQDPDVKENLDRELLLALWNRAQVILWIKRTGRYMPYIEKKLKENNLPDDLKYVAVVESALLANIGSNKNAVGYWQFIPPTGKLYGLAVEKEIDERRNLETSTAAAISYFQKLYSDFGSWTLAAAAYNMGEYGLKSAVAKQKTSNYYYLYLPLETQRYIYKILSVKLILSNPEKYGFTFTNEDLYQPRETDNVQVNCAEDTPLQVIADAAGTYYKIIRDLNPHFRADYLPAGYYTVSIPKGASKLFYAQYDTFYRQWKAESVKNSTRKQLAKNDSNTIYIVKKGDSLGMIAERFNVSIEDIIQWNKLDKKKSIHPGQRLTIYSVEIE